MTTKTPSPVRPAAPDAMETIAYESVAGIPTLEPHDRDRLGYAVWLWLRYRKDALETAMHAAGAKLLIPEEEAIERVRERLKAKGIPL
jgi:hypothetical protein